MLRSGKKKISLPQFSLLGSKIDSHGRKLWAFQLRSKRKLSAHSFSPFALMIDPSKENWGSAVYFLFLCEKIPKITELQGGNLAPTSSYKQQEPHGRPSVIFGNFWYLLYAVAKSRSRYPTFLYSDLRSIHMVGSYGHFNFGQKFILCQKKKKNQVPIASHPLL